MLSQAVFLSVLALAGVSLCLANGNEMPLFLLNSPRPYCIQVQAPEDTILRVYYEAPGMLLSFSVLFHFVCFQNVAHTQHFHFHIDIDQKIPGQEKQYAPTYMTISYNAHTVGPPNKGTMVQNHRPVSHEMLEHHGKVDFKVHPRNREDEDVGELQVCIRASKAGTKHPMRFGLFVEEVDEEEAEEKVDVSSHLTFLEAQLQHYARKMQVMLKTADMVREHDTLYHQKTDAMYQATIFWPVVHVGILLITGFTQAQHVVNFFQKRRII